MIVIKNNKDLEVVEGYLHDCVFQKDSIKYYPDRNEFQLETTREMWEKLIIHKVFLFIYKYEIPLIKCMLRFRKVLDFQIIQKEEYDRFIFLGIYAKENGSVIEIGSMYGPALRLKIEEIDGQLEDAEHVIENKIIKYGFRLFRNRNLMK